MIYVKLKDVLSILDTVSSDEGIRRKCKAIRKRLKELPVVDSVEVKHGEWIKHKPDPEAMKEWHNIGLAKGMSENSIFWTCSCCGRWGTPAHIYCSHCGAKMDGKEGAEE